MGRWLVILSLAMGQWPVLAAAEPQSTGIPLPKPRPVRGAPSVDVAVMRAASPAAANRNEPAVHESAQGSAQQAQAAQNGPASPARPAHEEPAVGFESLIQDWARDLRPAIEADAPRRSVRFGGGCNSGKRIISAYYWEGKRTASGEPFDPKGMTAAHRTLPFGTRLNISNPRTGKSIVVVVNDRGPFVSGVDLDLSLGAAQAIGMNGTGAVCIE
jgi:rare lipoprotein A